MDIQKYQPVIDDILRKLRVSKEQKQDLSQECYMALLENQEHLEAARDPDNYAATLCRNRVLELRRNDGRHHVPGESLDDPRVFHKAVKLSAPAPPDVDQEMMQEAMTTLPPDELEVVNRLYVEGYSRMETATSLGIHANTVDRRAKSGVEKLKKYFGEA